MPVTIFGVSSDRATLAYLTFDFFWVRGGGQSDFARKFICRKIIFLSENIAVDLNLKKGSVGI